MVMHDVKILAADSVWLAKWKYDEAEKLFYEKQAGNVTAAPSLAQEIATARQRLRDSIQHANVTSADSGLLKQLDTSVKNLEASVADLTAKLAHALKRIDNLEGKKSTSQAEAVPKKEVKADDDDDIDLFGSDEEDESTIKLREERQKAYDVKKAKKPALIAKSSVILDVKPWDDETDMQVMEEKVREIAMDGLVWGASKLVPLAYGIKKLQIVAVVEDEKVSIDLLQETIEANENYVQSVDVAAFNKL